MAADDGGASDLPNGPHARAGLAERLRGRVIRGGEGKVSDANIANVITVVRILFAPVFVALLLIDAGQDGPLRWVAFVLFVIGIATDGIDGMIARGRNLVSNVGILLDPIADKVLTGAALVGLTLLGELPVWVTALILIREIGITVFRFSVLKDRVIPASRGGKLKTLFQAFAISFALAPFTSLALKAGLIEIAQLSEVLNIVLMSIATILTVVTGVDYLVQARRINRAR